MFVFLGTFAISFYLSSVYLLRQEENEIYLIAWLYEGTYTFTDSGNARMDVYSLNLLVLLAYTKFEFTTEFHSNHAEHFLIARVNIFVSGIFFHSLSVSVFLTKLIAIHAFVFTCNFQTFLLSFNQNPPILIQTKHLVSF